MTTILAHRGNTDGPSSATENTLASVHAALGCGWGVELDIRRHGDGRFYISRDPQPSADGLVADAYMARLRATPGATMVLSLHEVGYESALVAYLHTQRVLRQTIVVEAARTGSKTGVASKPFAPRGADLRLAVRVTDGGESFERALSMTTAPAVWLSETERPWCRERHVRQLKAAGRQVYAVSPDLHHASPDVTRRRWIDFTSWGIDGISTDYAAALGSVLDVVPLVVAA